MVYDYYYYYVDGPVQEKETEYVKVLDRTSSSSEDLSLRKVNTNRLQFDGRCFLPQKHVQISQEKGTYLFLLKNGDHLVIVKTWALREATQLPVLSRT